MSDYTISRADLSYIERHMSDVRGAISQLSSEISTVQDQIQNTDQKVETVFSELSRLAEQVNDFIDESRRVASLADAKQSIVMLEQELQKKFGFHDEIRRHVSGILQASDLSIVRKETISTVTEEFMISAPKYWLAPALVALSAWLSDSRDIADRSLKEAIRRDDEKTSLLFSLICRRANRFEGSLTWLERYFGMQNPFSMENRVITVLDAYASGLFGPDAKGLVSSKIKLWIDELSSKDGFTDAQRERWSIAISNKTVSVFDSDFKYLSQYCTTWERMKTVLGWAKTHEEIHSYFTDIFNAKMPDADSLSDKIDGILNSLVSNYDDEELPLRREVMKNRLIIEENGDIDRAEQRYEAEVQVYDTYTDFSQHLTSVALTPDAIGALPATQKLAIALSKDWIRDAYEDLTAKSRSQVPDEIELKIENWTGKTKDGANEEELLSALNVYYDQCLERELLGAKLTLGTWVVFGLGCFLVLLGIAHFFFLLLGLGALGYWLNKKLKSRKMVKILKEQSEQQKARGAELLRATLAETVDFRRLYAEKDRKFSDVIDFTVQLSPEQYIGKADKNVRTILQEAR